MRIPVSRALPFVLALASVASLVGCSGKQEQSRLTHVEYQQLIFFD